VRLARGERDAASSEVQLGVGALLGLLAMPGAMTSFILLDKYSTFLSWVRGRLHQDVFVVSIPDKYLFLALTMAITGIVTVLKWDKILPDSQDYLNLAPLPIRPRTVLAANAAAIAIAVVVFAVDVNAVPAILFPLFVSAGGELTFGAFLRFAGVHAACMLMRQHLHFRRGLRDSRRDFRDIAAGGLSRRVIVASRHVFGGIPDAAGERRRGSRIAAQAFGRRHSFARALPAVSVVSRAVPGLAESLPAGNRHARAQCAAGVSRRAGIGAALLRIELSPAVRRRAGGGPAPGGSARVGGAAVVSRSLRGRREWLRAGDSPLRRPRAAAQRIASLVRGCRYRDRVAGGLAKRTASRAFCRRLRSHCGSEVCFRDARGSTRRLETYPANLCPLFGWAELAGFGEDFGQPIGKAVETASRRAVRQGSTEHLDCVLREEQRVNNAVYASAWRDDRRLRVWGQMPRVRAGHLEFVLQIVRGNLDVPHGHSWIRVAE
jgi:hypothetical protein